MSTGIPGGYTDWSFDLTPEALDVFNKAFQGLIGVTYEPFAFATQVVAGTNYSFLAKKMTAIPNPPLEIVKIHVFAPLPGQGCPENKGIHDIHP